LVLGIVAMIQEPEYVLGRPWQQKSPPICPTCGYNLRGWTSERCPECGFAPTFAELKRHAEEMADAVFELKNINNNTRVGVFVGAASLGLVLLLQFTGFKGLALLTGFFSGIGTLGCGLQVFRATRIPDRTLELMDDKPDFAKGVAVAALGLLILGVAIGLS
jgi:hypothetical protein